MTQADNTTESISAQSLHEAPRQLSRILLYLGPGLILAGNIVGTGELIATPTLSAHAGYTFLWLIIFSCVIKVFFQIEIGRYAISQGRTTLDSFNDLPGPRLGVNWLLWCWLVMYLCTLVQAGAMTGGVAQALYLALPWKGPHTETVYAIATGLSVIALLFNGRYGMVERIAVGLVALFSIITIYSVIQIQFTEYAITAGDIAHGLAFQLPDRPGVLGTALMAFGITGVGASELIAYPYWCLEKGYGRNVGVHSEEESWARRARSWVRVMQYDAWFSMVVFTVATVAFYLLGAAMLHPQGLVPEGSQMVATLNSMYARTFGDYAKYIFLLGTFCVLYSTLFASTAANARMLTDWLGIIGMFDRHNLTRRRQLISALCVFIPVFSTAVYLMYGTPVVFVMIGGISQALMLPLIGIAVMYFAYRRTDRRLAGGPIWFLLLWVSFVLMTIASLYGGYRAIAG